MKREAFNHPKMLDLASRLGVSLTHARGVIATLWNWTADNAFMGDVGKWNDGVIARACDWQDDPKMFVDSLVESGWVDRCEKHRLVIHDLEEHAPDWWKTKVKRLKKSFVIATPPQTTQVSPANTRANTPCEPSREHSDPQGASALLCSALLSSALLSSLPLNPLTPEASPKAARKQRKAFTIEEVRFPPELDTPAVRVAAQSWLDHKRDKGSPYRNAVTFADMLSEWKTAGPEAFVEAVAWSRRQNYSGIFSQGSTNGNNRNGSHTPGPGQLFDAVRPLGPV